ncbi:flagellar hook protein FlgE [Duganella vulcania]|uniref:Flagellar hook protein FlgE n=1 Tax=Duganella vulcania TaxID=2692166 RepID=A0A845H1C7_9BURK|nr:flagellar hook-basal body complex protein [Duganella vulcania]MYM98697.1 flagellar hook-basal body complex protein [Duganella vulcania]
MSFGIALSGIQAINEALDVTSHNIANAGTYGYKSSRANFSSLVAGDQPTGVNIGSKTQNIGLSGGILNTGRSLDASINGAGFFMVKDGSNTINYTRVGIFNTSKDGFLTDASGRRVQGATITPPSTTPGAQGDITIPTGQIPAVISNKLNYVGNLSADWKTTTFPGTVTPTTPPDPSTFSMSKTSIIYDTLGGQHTLTQYFGTSAPGKVDVNYIVDGNSIGKTTTLEFNLTSGQMTVPDPADPTVKGVFDMGDLSGIDTSDKDLWPGFTSGAKLTDDFKVDYTGTTYFAGEATTSTNAANGYASGTFAGVDLAKDGSVIAKYSNGQKQAVGKLTLATFPDEGALTQVDDTSWVQSLGSGSPLVNYAGVGTTGTLNTSSLEQSNVDITSELVGLMTSQRNYQANSKVIQTESQMMQSLMQAI